MCIQIFRDDKCITLSQLHYVEKIIKRFEHFGMLHMYTLYDSNVYSVKNHGDIVSQVNLHKSLVA